MTVTGKGGRKKIETNQGLIRHTFCLSSLFPCMKLAS